jgi:hypothetical protein
VGFAACQAILTVLSYWDGRGWHDFVYVVGTAVGLCAAWLLWSERTVLGVRSLRVKVGWRWRDLPWDDVQSVDGPSRWSPTQVLSVTTTDGQVIATHVPANLRQDVFPTPRQTGRRDLREPIERDDDAR